jgi:general secretion pathway protein D
MRAVVQGLVLVATLVAASAAPLVAQQPPPAPAPAVTRSADGVVVDFQDVDIRIAITALAEAAGLNVIFSDLPARRITLRLRQPVPVDSVRGLLRGIAESHGIIVTTQGTLLRFEAPRPVEPDATATRGAQAAPRLFVYRLRHTNAVRLAATLQGVFGGGVVEPAAADRPSLSQRLRDQRIPPMQFDTATRRAREDAAAAPSIGVVPRASTLRGDVQGEVQIVPDETTNSLLVRAGRADWDVVQEAIQALDLRPAQVLIEVVIAEVRRTSEYEVSVSGKAKRTKAGGSTTEAELKGVTTGDLVLRWMNGGKVNLDLALSLLATRGDVRIVSRPVILTQSNHEARILIGAQRPFVQVFRSLPTDAGVRDQIVQYRDVGTALTILPTVNPDGYVSLEVAQEVSSATNETQFGAPVISTREASTHLFVRDGQTTVIGGLIDRQGEKTRTGIPLLAAIPILGGLTGGTRSTTTVSELFLFLTPHVVFSDDDVDRVREGVEGRARMLGDEMRRTPPALPGGSVRVTPPPAAPTPPTPTPADTTGRRP